MLFLVAVPYSSCHRVEPYGREKLKLIRSSHDLVEFAVREGRYPSNKEISLREADGFFLTDEGDDYIVYLKKGEVYLCYYRGDFEIVSSLTEVRALIEEGVPASGDTP